MGKILELSGFYNPNELPIDIADGGVVYYRGKFFIVYHSKWLSENLEVQRVLSEHFKFPINHEGLEYNANDQLKCFTIELTESGQIIKDIKQHLPRSEPLAEPETEGSRLKKLEDSIPYYGIF